MPEESSVLKGYEAYKGMAPIPMSLEGEACGSGKKVHLTQLRAFQRSDTQLHPYALSREGIVYVSGGVISTEQASKLESPWVTTTSVATFTTLPEGINDFHLLIEVPENRDVQTWIPIQEAQKLDWMAIFTPRIISPK